MAKSIKETLLGTIVNGEEVLETIRVMRKVSKDQITEKSVTYSSDRIHKKELHLVVNDIIDTEKDAKIFRFVSEEGYLPPFEAGQYINLFTEIEGVRTSRPYSLSSSPRQRAYYEITVARTEDGFVSDYLLDTVKEGDRFSANGPSGVFRYQPVFHSKKSLFLAGGSGITPFLSMTREILEAGLDREIVMLYGCRSVKNALYHEELSALAEEFENFKYHLVLSEPEKDWKGESGFLDRELIRRVVPDYEERTNYICGPQIMNDFCKKELLEMGIPQKKIRREMFGARKDIHSEPGWPKDLTGQEVFKITVGNQLIEGRSGESLLTALERAGIRVNVCCRSGECSLCRVKLISGNVFLAEGMLRRYADEKYGYIHSCKAYPIGDLELAL